MCALKLIPIVQHYITFDGTDESYGLGRLVNNNPPELEASCKIERLVSFGVPHLCLFAKKDILPK